ncbi:MAG TPA: ABC transporter substrate-binding protein [Devosia sp.]
MRKHPFALGGATLLLGVSMIATQALAGSPTTPPDPPKFEAQQSPNFVAVSDILEFKALPEYHEPEYVKSMVDDGVLPPVKDRLPKEPMVYKTGNMPDGVGVYGDVMRHVIGGRPQGWNFLAGNNQGWGGIDIGMYECLTRTGPLFEVKAEDLQPMPNLAKSWEWSEDGHQLTMHLIEGAKWSDGVPFTSEDVMFTWENIQDPNITPAVGTTPSTFGEGTTLEAVDDYTIRWTFKEPFATQYLYQMAYGNMCPNPAHILSPKYPKNDPSVTYEEYKNFPPPEYMNYPVLGAWVVTGYRPDDIVILRRNPYYWKVDEAGNQLPYLDEVQYKLSTWGDRDVQAVAGTGDFSNLEQPENFVESLKRAADPNSPARLAFGARTIAYTLFPNLSGNGWGDPDERGQAVRDLNRNADFRRAVTEAIDRQQLGEALVKGPFTVPYPGGLFAETSFYDKASTAYYAYDAEGAKADLAKAGLTDTDGDGFVNFPAGVMNGGNVEVTMMINADYQTDKTIGETIVAMMERVGLRVIPNIVSGTTLQNMSQAGQYDWWMSRINSPELSTVVQNTPALAPTGPQIALHHRAGKDGSLDLLPFEQEMVDVVNKFTTTKDSAERVDLMKQYQKLYTENVWAIGLTQYPGALIINKRFANIPPGAPIYMYNWAEDNIIRERVYVPADQQHPEYELQKDTLPGAPG